METSFMRIVRLQRDYEPFSGCTLGQFGALDHLGESFEEDFYEGVPDSIFETKTKRVSIVIKTE